MPAIAANVLIEELLCSALPGVADTGLLVDLKIEASGKMMPDGPPPEHYLQDEDWEIESCTVTLADGGDLPAGLVPVIVLPDRKQITINEIPILTPENLKAIEDNVIDKLCAVDF